MTGVAAGSYQVLQHDGLFLVGVGAVVIVVAQLIWGAPRGLNATPMDLGRAPERFGWCLNAVGAALVAGGSVLILINNWPSSWFVISVAAGSVLVTVLAYRLTGRRKSASNRLSDRPLLVAALLAFLSAAALSTLELTVDGVRDWTAGRPLLVGVVSAALLVAPVLYFVEEIVSRRQAGQWRTTAVRVVETYIGAAGVFHERFVAVYLPAAAERLGRPTRNYRTDLQELAVEHPDFVLRVLGAIARDESDHVGQVTLTAVPAILDTVGLRRTGGGGGAPGGRPA